MVEGLTAYKIVVIVPTLNDEGTIGPVLDAFPRRELMKRGYEVQVVVVDGRSTDNTLSIARSKGARTMIQKGMGKGNAIRQAIALCDPRQVVPRVMELTEGLCSRFADLAIMLDARFVIITDPRGTYATRNILEMVSTLESGAEVVMGSRFLDSSADECRSSLSRAYNNVLSGVATFLFQRRCTDLNTGLWGFRTRSLRKLDLRSDHFDLGAELFAQAARRGLRIEEIAVRYHGDDRDLEHVSVRSGVAVMTRLIRCRFEEGGKRPDRRRARVKAVPKYTMISERPLNAEPMSAALSD